MDFKIGNRYKINKLIGCGVLSKIFTGYDIVNNEEVAIKIECKNSVLQKLKNEEYIYQIMRCGKGIPKLKYFGIQNDCKILVMELLGPNLEDFYEYCNKKFSLETSLILGIQILEVLEYLHNKGFIHRNIKPRNLLLGLGKCSKNVYLSDFGLAKSYIESNGKHVTFSMKNSVIGTLRFSSINNHLGYNLSRRDDLEQICYILVYFILGYLPWQSIMSFNIAERNENILRMKLSNSLKNFSILPKEIDEFWEYCRDMKFEDKPNYRTFINVFQNLLQKLK